MIERRKRDRPKVTCWEIVDVELAAIYWAATASMRDDYKNAIELAGHRAIVRDISAPKNSA